jgi:hypothetical protein
MDVDKMLAHAGDFGRYQYLLMLLFSVINILSTFDYFGQLFIFVQPEYWCHLPEVAHLPRGDVRQMWSPPEDAACSRYDTNLTAVGVVNGTPDWRGMNRTLRACDSGWDYNLTDGYRSIISEVSDNRTGQDPMKAETEVIPVTGLGARRRFSYEVRTSSACTKVKLSL